MFAQSDDAIPHLLVGRHNHRVDFWSELVCTWAEGCSAYQLESIEHWKELNVVQHELLVAVFRRRASKSHPEHVTYLGVDRTSLVAGSGSSSALSSPSSSSSSLKSQSSSCAAIDSVYVNEQGRDELLRDVCGRHIERFRLVDVIDFQQPATKDSKRQPPSPPPPTLREFTYALEAATLEKQKYNLKSANCYWYSAAVLYTLRHFFHSIVRRDPKKDAPSPSKSITAGTFSLGSIHISLGDIVSPDSLLQTYGSVVRRRSEQAESPQRAMQRARMAEERQQAAEQRVLEEKARAESEAQARALESAAKERALEAAGVEARRAQEEARRAQEEAQRAQEEARRAQEEARRAQEEARRAQLAEERAQNSEALFEEERRQMAALIQALRDQLAAQSPNGQSGLPSSSHA